jgi:hypothetical protein
LQSQGYIGENSNSEAERDSNEVESIELCKDTHSAPDFSDQDGVEIRAEPIPPDKNIISLNSDLFLSSNYIFDSPLNVTLLQYSHSDTREHCSVETCTERVYRDKSVISIDYDPSIFSDY